MTGVTVALAALKNEIVAANAGIVAQVAGCALVHVNEIEETSGDESIV
jgi:hypothetical protein